MCNCVVHLLAAFCLITTMATAMADPGPLPDMGNTKDRLPPLLTRLLAPSMRNAMPADEAFQQRSEEEIPSVSSEASIRDFTDADVIIVNEKVITSSSNNGTSVNGNQLEGNGTVDKDPREQNVAQGEQKQQKTHSSDKISQGMIDDQEQSIEEKPTFWNRVKTAANAFVAVLRGDVAASKQIVDIGELPNLLDVMRRGGIDVDLTNGRINFDFNVIVTELVVVAVPIVITALLMGYMWILFGLVEFDYTVFGPHERVVPNVVPGTYSERMGILDSDGAQFVNQQHEKQLVNQK